ncbi:MAG TPA: hypothetical protein VG818_02355 [Gemmatimonadaceae bacterium]|nr:hypothetical protein [Gemmatimonadaceae bacterium]
MKRAFSFSKDGTVRWRSSVYLVRLVALLMASLAFAGALYVTEPAGPGLDPDAASYMGAAESLASGHGLRIPYGPWYATDSTAPLSHFPPGFPAAIAVPVSFGFPPAQAARLIEALAAFASVLVLLSLVGDASGPAVAALLGIALLGMPALVDAHLSVLSEPLFLAALAFTLAAMVAAAERPWVAGIGAAASLLVRYAGASLVGATMVWAFLQRGALRQRLARAALAALPALLTFGPWVFMVRDGSGGQIRDFGVYGGLGETFAEGWTTLGQWLAPSSDGFSGQGWLALAMLVVLVALVVAGARRVVHVWRNLPVDIPLVSSATAPQLVAGRTLAAAGVMVTCYAGFVLLSRLVADPFIPFDERILAPVFVLVAVVVAVCAATWWRHAPRPLRVALAGILLAWSAASWMVTHDNVQYALDYGSDFAGEQWRGSALLDWARTEGRTRAIFSNWPVTSYFYLGRPSHEVPQTADPRTLRAFGDTLARRNGVILAFRVKSPEFVNADVLRAAIPLHVLASFPDGDVLAPATP